MEPVGAPTSNSGQALPDQATHEGGIMGIFRTSRRRVGALLLSTAVLATGGVGLAIASSPGPATPSNATHLGHGINEFGMTKAFFDGHRLSFTYNKGFFCDTSVRSTASSGCEAGATFNKAPADHFDPLFITVPLGFDQPMNMIDCPAKLVCVDHPGTIDLRRLEPALKPLYPTLTKSQLLAALANFPVPAHDHFITDANNNKAEWWDVHVVGVTSQRTFDNIRAHESYGFIRHLINNHNPHVVGPIPTNLFLFFSVH
jgi:hypothetical protein